MQKDAVKRNTLVYGILTIFALITLIPFVWMTLTSFRSMKEIITEGPLALPGELHFENYFNAWINGNFGQYYSNSIIVAAVTVICVLVLTVFASYAFTYLNFTGKGISIWLIIIGLVLPGELTMIPLFHNLKSMGLLNSLWAIILPQIGSNLPFGIFLIRGFMRNIPKPLLEAARLDGATEAHILLRIIMPLIKPAVVSLFIFTAMGSWNSFMLPNIMIQSDKLKTLPIGLNNFRSRYTVDFPLSAAGGNIVAFPMIIVYLIFQKNIINGMMLGAVKE